jgi:signal peptidase I
MDTVEGETTPTTASSTAEQPKEEDKDKGRPLWQELPILLVIALALALLIKAFVVQAFYIPSASMEPTLQHGDRVLVNRNAYRFHPPRRGDIIVFSDPHPTTAPPHGPAAVWDWVTQGLGVQHDPNKDFIKRVIGLPGETVELQHGTVYIDGKPLKDEPYLSPIKDFRNWGPHTVPADHLFVLGDNRTDSGDSRYGLGDIPYKNVIGRAFVLVWPPTRWSWLSAHPIQV